MARDLRDKVLIITGASSGIGAATAIEAGRAQMRVVLAARRRERLERVAEQVKLAGGEALAIPTDVSDFQQIDRLIEQTVEHFGRIDACFANAGFGEFRAMMDGEDEAERRMWQVNYFGALHCLRRAGAVMKRQRSGHLLMCSSILARAGLPYYGTYCATKAAQDAAVQAMQLELKPYGIAVSGVYPGSTETEFHEQVRRRNGAEPISGNTPRVFIQSAEQVGQKVIACLRRPKPEVWPSRLSRLGAVLWTACPRFRTFCFRFHARKARQLLQPEADGGNTHPESAAEPKA